MKTRIVRLEREVGAGLHPYAHLSDDELQAALERTRRGEPGGVSMFPGPPETWSATGLEHLSDAEVLARLEAARALLVPHPQHRRKE